MNKYLIYVAVFVSWTIGSHGNSVRVKRYDPPQGRRSTCTMTKYEDRKVNCVKSYHTVTGISEHQCVSYCQYGMPRCKGAQYDQNNRKCELFDKLIPMGGRGSSRGSSLHHRVKRFDPPQGHRRQRPRHGRGRRRPHGPGHGCGGHRGSHGQRHQRGHGRHHRRPHGGGRKGNCGCYYGGQQVSYVRGVNFYQPNENCFGQLTTATSRPFTTLPWTPYPTTRWTPVSPWTTKATWTPRPWTTRSTTTEDFTDEPIAPTEEPITPTEDSFTTEDPVTPTEEPLPTEVTCPPGQAARFMQIDGFELQGYDEINFQTSSSTDCLLACTNNRMPDGTQVPCRSAEFDINMNRCYLSMEVLMPSGDGVLVENADKAYYEKICVEEFDSTMQCQGPYWRAPQWILVGFAQTVVDAFSLEDCVSQCLGSQEIFGFTCNSGMMFYDEDFMNCVLNSDTAQTQPDLFTEYKEEAVEYFETGCEQGTRNLLPRDNLNVLSMSSQWGKWTPCNKRNNKRLRFRECNDKSNPQSCRKDEERCTAPRALRTRQRGGCNLLTSCCPIRRSDGTLNCEHGRTLNRNIGRRTCKPTNCS